MRRLCAPLTYRTMGIEQWVLTVFTFLGIAAAPKRRRRALDFIKQWVLVVSTFLGRAPAPERRRYATAQELLRRRRASRRDTLCITLSIFSKGAATATIGYRSTPTHPSSLTFQGR